MSDAPHGPAGEDRFHSARLRQLVRLDLDEATASELWSEVALHRAELARQLHRDVGQRVALLDFVLNVSPRLVDPQIIERAALVAIEHRAVEDPLTGLFNRAYFDAVLHRETERCERSGVHATLALMDLDRFKRVNDRDGHEAGDAVLRAVAVIVRDELRSVDIACRFGGDELAAVLTDTRAAEAMQVAERVRAAVAAAFSHLPAKVTVSIGLAELAPSPRSSVQSFTRADRALYDAKHAGGDRVVLAVDAPASTGPRGPGRRRAPSLPVD